MLRIQRNRKCRILCVNDISIKPGEKKRKCKVTADPRETTAATHQLGGLLGQSLPRTTCTKLVKGRL